MDKCRKNVRIISVGGKNLRYETSMKKGKCHEKVFLLFEQLRHRNLLQIENHKEKSLLDKPYPFNTRENICINLYMEFMVIACAENPTRKKKEKLQIGES